MGQCMSNQKTRKPTYRYCETIQTQTIKSRHNSKLNFHAVIANLILKKYPYNQASPIIRLSQFQSFKLDEKIKSKDESIKWKIQQKFDFQMSEKELRKSFLEIDIQNQYENIVGKIKINLYLIATGPFHQDFAIEYQNGKIGRINFDLKLSQIIEVKIKAIAAQIQLLKDHPGQEFSYSIKTIAGYNGQASYSQSSYPAVVLLEKEILEFSYKSQYPSPKKVKKDSNEHIIETKEIQAGKHIKWRNTDGKLPCLTTKVLASQLHNTYFQVLIWKCQESINEKSELFADTYVSFYKLFATQGQRISQAQLQYQSRNINIAQKIQHYGKDYGKGIFSFNIANQHYFKQYQICVHTQIGILKTAPIFQGFETKPSDLCPQLKDMLNISEKIQQDVINLNNLQATACLPSETRKIKSQVQMNLQRIFNLMQKTSHSPVFLFEYSSESDLLKGQEILVSLGLKIMQYLQIEDPIINDVCWLILISLVKRAQFNLSHMGFNEKQQNLIITNKINNHLNQKLKLVNIFKNFTYKLLNLALTALNRKGSQYQNIFAEVYCACAYFKIPQFRKQILKLINRQTDPEINQWRAIQFNLHDDIQQKHIRKNANIFSQLFDWQQHFYKWTAPQDDLGQNLNDIISQQQWKLKIKSRGFQFFYFLKYWVTYIESNLPFKKDIQWRYFPGYNRLLQGFFAEMKQHSILSYPDALIQSSLKLLANQKLINPIMMIALNKVNVYDSSAVIRAIQYMNIIFQSFTTKKKFLPISFNYSFFFKCIKIILESQTSIGISSVLTLIYNHFNLYHIEFRRSLSMYFLGKIFWKLFLHWSHTVRKTFYYLITFRIYGQAYNNIKIKSTNRLLISDNNIIQRYKQIIKIINNKQNQIQYNSYLDLHLYQSYHKKMSFKLRKKKNYIQLFQPTTLQTSIKQISLQQSRRKIKNNGSIKQNGNYITWGEINDKQYHSEHYKNAKKYNNQNIRVQDDNFWDDSNQQFILFQKIIHDQQFQLQQIQAHKIKFLDIYMPEFKTIELIYTKSLQKQNRICPHINYQISIDNRQIRPKQIDNW